MRTLNALPIIIFLLAACTEQQPNVALRAELLEMGRIDQQGREQAALLIGNRMSAEELMSAVKEQQRVRTENLSKLQEIIKKYGWPGRKLVGEKAAGAALIVLQHADIKYRKQYLPLLRASAANGDIPPVHLARLEDDIRAGEGRPQIYGTRVVSESGGSPTLYPIEDPKNLDSRRKAFGLPPIEDQLKQMEAEIGMHINRGNLPSD